MARFQRTEAVEGDLLDPETGEVKHHVQGIKSTIVTKGVPEEDYIKVYYDTYLAALGENSSSLSAFLVALGKRMSYSSEGQRVYLVKPAKEDIAKELGVSVIRVNSLITRAVKAGIIQHVGYCEYAVSPFIVAKGDWDSVQHLRLEYDAKSGAVELSKPRDMVEADHEVEEVSDGEDSTDI